MQKTTNYNLNQWEAGDRVTRADFNADNAAIDAAIKSVADAAAGGAKVVYGSYVGDGTSGKSNPNTLTFSSRPLALFICGEYQGFFVQGTTIATSVYGANTPKGTTISWSGTTVSWYSTGGAPTQLNTQGQTYYYVAILDPDT